VANGALEEPSLGELARVIKAGTCIEASFKPTVCLDVTSLVVYSYGYNSGKIVQLVAH